MYLKILFDELEGGKYFGFKGLSFGFFLIFKVVIVWNI